MFVELLCFYEAKKKKVCIPNKQLEILPLHTYQEILLFTKKDRKVVLDGKEILNGVSKPPISSRSMCV